MRGRLKIVRLKTAVIEGNFDWTFVRIETDEGIQGLGECFFAPGLTSILRSLEPVILGEDSRDVHRLFRKLQLATSGAGSVAGIVYNAISGIEAALWDVLGQGLHGCSDWRRSRSRWQRYGHRRRLPLALQRQ